MEARELRIGNWVNETGDEVKVGKDTFRYWDELKLGDVLKPIPLTEEWLLKMGFVPTKEAAISGIWFSNGFIDYCIRGGSVCFKQEPIRRIKYVHQLQNLYFELYGVELKLKN